VPLPYFETRSKKIEHAAVGKTVTLTKMPSPNYPGLGALLENVAPDGLPLLDLPEGRMFHPGHAIESAWMLMEIAHRGPTREGTRAMERPDGETRLAQQAATPQGADRRHNL
jgi:hypothetical protein